MADRYIKFSSKLFVVTRDDENTFDQWIGDGRVHLFEAGKNTSSLFPRMYAEEINFDTVVEWIKTHEGKESESYLDLTYEDTSLETVLKKLTIKELRARAAEHHIVLGAKAKKSEMVEVLLQAQVKVPYSPYMMKTLITKRFHIPVQHRVAALYTCWELLWDTPSVPTKGVFPLQECPALVKMAHSNRDTPGFDPEVRVLPYGEFKMLMAELKLGL